MEAIAGLFKISSHKFRNDITHLNYVEGLMLMDEVFRIVIAKVGVASLALLLLFVCEVTIKCFPSSIIVFSNLKFLEFLLFRSITFL